MRDYYRFNFYVMFNIVDTTHESTYTRETISELYGIEKLPDGKFPLFLNS